jgi:hypothetical protein
MEPPVEKKQKKKRIRRTRAEIERFEAERAEASKKMLEAMERTVTTAVTAAAKEDNKPLPEVINLDETEPIESEKPKSKRVRMAAEEAPVTAEHKRVRPQDVLPVLESALQRKDPRYRLKFALGGGVLGAALFYCYAPNIVLASSNLI